MATAADPLPADAFYEYTAIRDIATSPDGERVAFVATESDEDEDRRRQSVFVAPTDGSDEPHRLTRASDAGSPEWSPDGSKLAITAAREQDAELAVEPPEDTEDDENGEEGAGGDGGDDGPEKQVWVFDLVRGGDARQVTDRSDGVTGFDWGPDGERIVVAAPDPTDDEEEYQDQIDDDGPIEIERLQHKVNGTGWTDTVTTYLFVVDVETREETRLDRANDGELGSRRPLAPAWSPDGDRIAFTAYLGENPDDTMALDLYTIRPDGTGRERLTDGERRLQAPAWSPDGDRIAFVGGDPTNWYIPTEVFVADADTGEDHSVSASLDRTVAWGGGPEWIDGGTLVALIADEGNSSPVRLDADTDDPTWLAPWQGDDRAVRALDPSDDGERATVLVSDPSAADVYALDVDELGTVDGHSGADPGGSSADDDPLDRVTTANEGLLDEAQVPDFERVTWENTDGIEIEGLVYLPADFDPDDPDARPVVASVHGGPMAYDAPAFGFDTPYWTSRGYVVLRTNYRGSTSYGREFSERLRGTRGEKEVDDVVSGVDHLVERGWADDDRAFVTGFSYGGITTAAVVTSTDRFAAAAAEHGIYDFYSVFGTDDNHNWHEDEFGLPWENPETYRELSSLTDVGDVDTPLLVTAGEHDWRCPPTQAEQLHVSLKKQGVDSKLVIYQDEHHNIGDPDRAIHRIEALTDWFDDHDPATE